jgi:2-(1,2-epoxy-1,2-dihydrophenyl)acetyl-CoA isomerase
MPTVHYALDDAVATITLDDPATLNAASLETTVALREALERAGEEARCTILTGAGRGFCSGADLSGDIEIKGELDLGLGLETHYHPLIGAMRRHPHPLITAVNGAAAGVGCSIALLGDLVLCAESAYFLQAFRHIGLVPDGGSTYLLPRLIGRARAMEMVLLGDRVGAAEALDWGLCNRVVPDEALLSTARELATALSRGPTRALALGRRLIWESADRGFDAQLHAEREAQAEAGRTADFREGVRAFREKRKARFEGR